MNITTTEKDFLMVLKENYCSDEKKQCAIFKLNDLLANEAVKLNEKEVKGVIMTLFDKGLIEGLTSPNEDNDDYPFIAYDLDLTVSLKDL